MILHFSNICHDNDGHTENALSQPRHFFPMISDQSRHILCFFFSSKETRVIYIMK